MKRGGSKVQMNIDLKHIMKPIISIRQWVQE